jgi:2'-5' RNA ligase
MLCDPNGDEDPINSFALVSYIPGRLGEFLDRLRQELVPGCIAHAHVTVLPPRPLAVDPQLAEEEIRVKVTASAPFYVEIPRIRIFEATNVVFADIGSGRSELFELHDALNRGSLAFDEPYSYHPHITLAQNIPADAVPETFEHACRRWYESAPARGFAVEALTFVQNTIGNLWLDLSECELRGAAELNVR